MPASLARNSCDAELFEWILEQVRTAFRLQGWQKEDRQAERLCSGCGAPLEQEERRCYTLARQLGKGVRFLQCNAFSVGAALDAAPAGEGSEQTRNMP
jgi:hypothetical protein